MPNDSLLTAWPLLNGRMVAQLQEFHFNSNLMLNFFGLLMYSKHTEIHPEPGNVLFLLNKCCKTTEFYGLKSNQLQISELYFDDFAPNEMWSILNFKKY